MTLAEQIRALYGTRGDWNQGGIDRAQELADLLMKAGVTDVSQIALQKGTRQEQQFSGGEDGQWNAVDLPANQVLFGDKRIGFAGDYNNDNTYGSKASDYLQGDNVLGWSARGHGNVTYKVGTDAQGNNYLTPEWGSSSDMKDVRSALKAAAAIAAMAYGVPMLGAEAAPALTGVDAAMADLAASGGLTGSSMAAAAPSLLSSAPMTTTLGTPLAELTAASALPGSGAAMTAGGLLTGAGAPALLSEAAIGAGMTGGLTGLAGAAGAAGSTLGTAAGAGAAGGLLKAALPVAGAVLGATSSKEDTTATTKKDMDPRLANYVYGADGTGGLLGSASKVFNDQMATGGLNELQRQGIDLQKNFFLNPAYAQGYTNMMNVGQGLLSGGVAGNPFRR